MSTKCMMVFGREVCLCEFVNWVYDQTGNNPLYRCYSSGGPALQPAAPVSAAAAAGAGSAQTKELQAMLAMQQQVAETRQKLNEILAKAGKAGVSSKGAAAATATGGKAPAVAKGAAKVDPKASQATSQQGWGSKIADYGYGDDEEYYQFDGYYDGEDQQIVLDDNDNNNNKKNNDDDEDAIEIKPSFWTEGDGFGQTVFIGINTFWGLMMLSVFFGMMSCTVVCAVLNFQRMFCRDGFFKLDGSESYEWKRMQKDYQSDGLDTIDEDDNVKHPEKDPGAGGWVSNSAEDEQLVK